MSDCKLIVEDPRLVGLFYMNINELLCWILITICLFKLYPAK